MVVNRYGNHVLSTFNRMPQHYILIVIKPSNTNDIRNIIHSVYNYAALQNKLRAPNYPGSGVPTWKTKQSVNFGPT